jgi:hypothetical protein
VFRAARQASATRLFAVDETAAAYAALYRAPAPLAAVS